MCKKILVVEDSENISFMVKMFLQKHGYEVMIVYDGVDAIDAVFKCRPDIILLDVLIPRMNGYLVAETIKQNDDTKNIPIVVMSARAQLDEINHALELGVEDYLVKPFTTDKLLEKINKYLS